MVRNRGALAVAVVVMILFSAIPVVFSENDTSDAADDSLSGLLIYELQPTNKTDGFAIKNYGPNSITLNGHYVVDGFGTTSKYTLPKTTLGPNGILAVTKTATSGAFCEGETDIQKRIDPDYKINLNNSGDALYLYDDRGGLLDTVCYGNYTAPTGWSGTPVDLGFKKDTIRRCERTDTDTYFDWVAVGMGFTAFSFDGTKTVENTTVSPFTFPECGGRPILEELKKADRSINISIYMLTSEYVASVLKDRVDHGVSVKIILENNPLGNKQNNTANLLKSVDDDPDGEVRFIGGDAYDRYSYVHNKYAIIDEDTVIITSENWTSGNISRNNGNRGWGAVVYGTEFATEMGRFFNNDWNFSDDLSSLQESYPDATAIELSDMTEVNGYIDGISYSAPVFDGVKASIYMSPDNTFKALQKLISKASSRVYTEQMDIGSSFEDLNTFSPLSSMRDAAERGVDARFMVADKESTDLVKRLNTYSKVKAAIMKSSGYATMHNKGVIIDDTVWVSSVNWTENAFMNNRECGLYLQSAKVTEFFLESYMTDWNYNWDPEMIFDGNETQNVLPDLNMDLPPEEAATVGGGVALFAMMMLLILRKFAFGSKKGGSRRTGKRKAGKK